MHVGIKGRCHHEQRGTPAGGADTILKNGEDSLGSCAGRTIVAHEQHLIRSIVPVKVGTRAVHTSGVELVGAIHDHLGILGGIGPTGSTGINLSIEVEASQQQVGGIAVNTAITFLTLLEGTGSAQAFTQVEKLLLQPLKQGGTAHLLGILGSG